MNYFEFSKCYFPFVENTEDSDFISLMFITNEVSISGTPLYSEHYIWVGPDDKKELEKSHVYR